MESRADGRRPAAPRYPTLRALAERALRVPLLGKLVGANLLIVAAALVVVVAEQVLVSHGRLPSRPVIEVVHRDATGPGTLGGSVEKS